MPVAARGVGTSTTFTPGAPARVSSACCGVTACSNSACTTIVWPVNTGTRTHVPATFSSGIPRILRDSLRSFCSSSVSAEPSSTSEPANGSALNAMGSTYGPRSLGLSTSSRTSPRGSPSASTWVASASTPASPEPETAW